MHQPNPETIRAACARPVQALRDPVPSSAPPAYVMPPDLNLVADPFGQHFDVLSRPQGAKSNNWAIWWSDLMMTMFIMFAALYAFHMPKSSRIAFVPEAPAVVHEASPPVGDSILARIHDQGREAIRRHGLDAFAEPRLVPDKSVRFILDGVQLFDPGASEIKSGAKGPLRHLAEVVRSAPYKVTLVGHAAADESAVGGSAWMLSTARANALAGFLTSVGVPARNMIVVGYGDQEPLRPGVQGAGAVENRRAEIVISVENPTDPLPPNDAEASRAGVRKWMTSRSDGGETWNENH